MAVQTGRSPVETLAAAAAEVAATRDLRAALARIAESVAEAAGADLAVVRVVDAAGDLVARAVAPEGSALAAAVAGTRAPVGAIADGEPTPATDRAAEQARATDVLAVPALARGRVVGAVELVRIGEPLGDDAEGIAGLAAAQLALVQRALGADPGSPGLGGAATWLDLAGEALASSGDASGAAVQIVRVAVEATAAQAGALWLVGESGLEPAASIGPLESVDAMRELARAAVETWSPPSIEIRDELPGAANAVATLTLGQPTFGVLQLLYLQEAAPGDLELALLAPFAARAAHALRAGERAREVEAELDRTRALLEVVGAAIAQLSLAHTLETAVGRIAELLDVEQVGVYLLEEGGLRPAAERGLREGHEAVAAELLAAARGPLRARPAVRARIGGTEPVLAQARRALEAASQPSAVGVPLYVRDESIGLLVVYPGRRSLAESDVTLLASLAAQLAVAVQNARLHERAKELGAALGSVLESERQTSRQVSALYEISRSFAQSLSLDTTLDAVTQTIVGVLDVDAAVIRVPDERGDLFVPRAVHVADEKLGDPVRTILRRPQPRPALTHGAALLDPARAARLGGAHALLIPFLDKGSTAALLPIATQSELLAELTILSLDPADPIDGETIAAAGTIAQQAALAIDNARLYQQQKAFAETMQQSLLPREHPQVPGIEIGAVYESAAQVDVGGDVFDFLELADGRLAVVLGDVTGHGIDATADMAMAKFVFRSLAREHPEPSDFLAHANDVVVDEIAAGKFITMAYVTVDPAGAVLGASAGHPAPRLVLRNGDVRALDCGGLALGIVGGQDYVQTSAELPGGAAVVLYTDGVIEARRDGELFGSERLDSLLAAHAAQPAQAIADAVVGACRAFAGGDLGDDCAIVVIRRS
jgi:serine phosphatase RsbU (regulator of sigma subunit)